MPVVPTRFDENDLATSGDDDRDSGKRKERQFTRPPRGSISCYAHGNENCKPRVVVNR